MDPTVKPKPYWLPDTQGFLAIAIIVLIGTIVLLLIMRPIVIDERTSGVLMTVIGVLTACLKDVYSFFFGSSKGSDKKDDALIKTVADTTSNSPPPAPPAPVIVNNTTSGDISSDANALKPAAAGG